MEFPLSLKLLFVYDMTIDSYYLILYPAILPNSMIAPNQLFSCVLLSFPKKAFIVLVLDLCMED